MIPVQAPPCPWEAWVQLLTPLEGTELGLDEFRVRVRVKKDLGSGFELQVVGVRVSVRLRVVVRVTVRFMVRFRVRLTVASGLALCSESGSGSVLG